jgi:hypothetical protein
LKKKKQLKRGEGGRGEEGGGEIERC